MPDVVVDNDNAPQIMEDKPEQQPFNQSAREALESSFDEFVQGEAVEATAPEETAPIEDKPADKTVEVEASVKQPETPPVEEWKPEFKDHKTAEESYRHARLKMQQALEEAAAMKRELEQARYVPPEPPRMTQEPTSPPPPMMDKEAIEAEFFRDPVGFQLAMNEAMARHAVEQAEAKISEKDRQRRIQNLQYSMTQKLNEHFDTKYPELKPMEPMVLTYGDSVRQDRTFMEPLLASIKEAPNELKARKIFEVSKAVMDEGVRRLREKLPEIGKGLGFQIPGEPQTERLTSGAPSVVPGGSSGPVVRTKDETTGQTASEYMRERLHRQEKIMAGSGRWKGR